MYFLLFGLFFLSGCHVGPKFVSPENNVPDTWIEAPSQVEVDRHDPVEFWWEEFNDPLLTRYIELAREFNYDLKIAASNIVKARAERNEAASYLYPQINHDFNAGRLAFSKNGPFFSRISGGAAPNQQVPTIPRFLDLFSFLVDATWEIDLFGKRTRAVEAADAEFWASVDNYSAMLLSIYAEVAKNYVEVRTAQKNILLIEKNMDLIENSVALVKQRVNSGLDNTLSLERIEAELASVHSTLPQVIAREYRAIYNLSILLGLLPEALLEEMLPIEPMPCLKERISLGVRSDLLQRRPDIKQKSKELEAATANVGVAYASFSRFQTHRCHWSTVD